MKSDFLAFSYYYSLVIDSSHITNSDIPNYYMSEGKVKNEMLQSSEFGWQIDSVGFRNTITKIQLLKFSIGIICRFFLLKMVLVLVNTGMAVVK